MLAAAALAFLVLVFFMPVPAAAALTCFTVVVMMFTAATTTAFFFVMVMMPAAAAAAFFIVMMMVVTAATAAAFFFVMVMMTTTAAATFLFVVMMVTAATAAALFFTMVMMAAAAATAATAAVRMAFNANRFERFFDFGHFKTDHAEHLGNIRKRKHGKAFRCFGHFDAAVDQRGCRFLHRAKVARHMKNLFNSRTNNPETPLIVNEDVVDEKRARFFNGNGHGTFVRIKRFMPGHAFGSGQHELLGTIENGLSRRGFGRKELGKSRHD